jgi:hypothetical protein
MLTSRRAIYDKQEAAANKGNVHSKNVRMKLICYLAGCLQNLHSTPKETCHEPRWFNHLLLLFRAPTAASQA